MAKKTSGARPSKKTTAKKKAPAVKKTAKKPAVTKKKTAKKPVAKAATKKTAKKTVNKAVTKPITKKVTKKAPTKKVPSKKAASKKPPVTKKTTKKAPAAKKTAPSRSRTTKKTGSKKTASRAAGKSTGTKVIKKRRRFGGGDAAALKASKDAAARLAAAAGLMPVVSAKVEETKASRYKKITKSPLSTEQLNEFREILRTKRALIVGDVSSMELEALTGGNSGALSNVPQHMADQGSDTFDQSLNLDLAASQRKLLKEIDDALERIENGTFGICEQFEKAIKIDRLRNTPWARYSIEAARQIEHKGYFPS